MRSGWNFDFGGAHVEILSPPPDYVPAASPKNNDSLAMRLTYGRRSFLLTGDMERPMELRALAAGGPLAADVLKVGHHGSNTSSTREFLDAVSPTFAVISDGFENSFHHPHPLVLERLLAHHAERLAHRHAGTYYGQDGWPANLGGNLSPTHTSLKHRHHSVTASFMVSVPWTA